MAASDHLHPQQMQLFVDPVEHIASVRGAVDMAGHTESWDDMWGRKESEARNTGHGHGAGLYDSVKDKGIRAMWSVHAPGDNNPRELMGAPKLYPANDGNGFIQGDGHHRMAAAAAVQRDTGKAQYVPVEYKSSSLDPRHYR